MNRVVFVAMLLAAAWLAPAHDSGLRTAEAAERAPAGVPFTDLEDRTRTLDDWSGQTRLVNFWATWCGPCREEMPLFQEAYERFEGRGFQIIGVALDRAKAVARFRERLGITYPLVTIDMQAGMDMMRRYGNTAGAVPYSVLLSPDGEVLARHLGAFTEAQLDQLLDEHLQQPVSGTAMTRLSPPGPRYTGTSARTPGPRTGSL